MAGGQAASGSKAGEECNTQETKSAWQSMAVHVKEFVEASPDEHKE